MTVLYTILGLLVLLILVIVLRAALLRPTPALTAEVELAAGERAERYAGRLAQMIRKETVSSRYEKDRKKFYEFHRILEELFPLVHEKCEKRVFDGSLLFRLPGKGKKEPILFMSHQDVVEAGGTWEHGAFSGDLDETGRIWGRGTVDTKGSLFCIFTALEELLADGFAPEGDLYIASSCTEEFSGDGAPQTVRYLKEQGVRLAYLMDEGGMIIKEPIGGVRGTYAMVGVLEKGYGDLKFIARGKGGHASAPGKNTPLVRLAKFMCDVEKHNPFRVSFNGTVLEMFRRTTPNMKFGMKVIFANMWLFRGLLGRLMPSISAPGAAMLQTTAAFTTARGSDGLNVLPQEAYVTGNLRFIPHQPAEESIRLISGIAAKYDIETEVIYRDDPCPAVDYQAAPFKQVEEVAAKIYPGVGVCPYVMTGGTDAKFYREICDNCLRFAPLYIDGRQYASIHGLNENIFAGALPKGVDFYKEMMRRQ